MRIFLSYSRDDQAVVERIRASLNAAGFEAFLDTKDLPFGQEFNARIKLAIEDADLFIFLASDASVRPGSYALTELSFAETKWRNPSGYVLPVLLESFSAANLPAYLRPINAMRFSDNVDAQIVGWVEDRASLGSIGIPDRESPQARLERWARLAQPPIRATRRAFLWSGPVGVVFGILFIGFGIIAASLATQFNELLGVFFGGIPALVGAGVILYSLWMTLQGLRGSAAPVAVVVLDRETTERGVWLKVETGEGKRLSLRPIRRDAKEAHTGDLGWAYIRGSMLIDFVPA